jgi:hypothetical protein
VVAGDGGGGEIAPEWRIESPEALAALGDMLAVRIVRAATPAALTVEAMAAALGEPVADVQTRVASLEAHGLLRRVDDENAGRVAYRARALLYLLAQDLARGGLESPGLAAALRFVLGGAETDIRTAVASRAGDMAAAPPSLRAILARRTFAHLGPERARDFYERLIWLFDEFAEAHDETQAQPYALSLVLTPLPARVASAHTDFDATETESTAVRPAAPNRP